MEKIIARGAEAVIIKSGNSIIKTRVTKGYRLPILDERLRKLRTRSEAKLIEKAGKIISVPRLISSPNSKSSSLIQSNQQRAGLQDNYTLQIEHIAGKKLSDNLEKLNYAEICRQIGSSLAKLHDAGIIHGDLTTSNLIYVPKSPIFHKKPSHKNNNKSKAVHEGKVFFIDFGLGFHSNRIEDKAVDLHLIKEALEAKHPKIYEKAFKSILEGYKSSQHYQKTIKQLEKVEKRGRYKAQY